MLSNDTLKSRIDAARTLRGMKQEDLAKLLAADGLGKHDLGRLERGQIPFKAVHRHALVRHLRVPEAWFTEEELDLTGPAPTETVAEEVRRLADRIDHAEHLFERFAERARDERSEAVRQWTAKLDELLATVAQNNQLLASLATLETEWRNASRSISQLHADLLGDAAPTAEAAGGTQGSSDAIEEVRRAHPAGKPYTAERRAE